MFIINKLHAQAVTPERAMLGFTPTVQVNINPFPLESQLGVTLKPFPEQSGFKLLMNKMTERISIEREKFLYSPFRNSIPFRVLTCVTGSNGFSDVWAKDSKVKVTRLREKKKKPVKKRAEELFVGVSSSLHECVRIKVAVLTTSSFSMAAESLSPVALNSSTLATAPLKQTC